MYIEYIHGLHNTIIERARVKKKKSTPVKFIFTNFIQKTDYLFVSKWKRKNYYLIVIPLLGKIFEFFFTPTEAISIYDLYGKYIIFFWEIFPLIDTK